MTPNLDIPEPPIALTAAQREKRRRSIISRFRGVERYASEYPRRANTFFRGGLPMPTWLDATPDERRHVLLAAITELTDSELRDHLRMRAEANDVDALAPSASGYYVAYAGGCGTMLAANGNRQTVRFCSPYSAQNPRPQRRRAEHAHKRRKARRRAACARAHLDD